MILRIFLNFFSLNRVKNGIKIFSLSFFFLNKKIQKLIQYSKNLYTKAVFNVQNK